MRVGIIGAMDVEVEYLKSRLGDPRVSSRAGREFCEGILGHTAAVVCQCGVGKVNAATCAQVLCDAYSVSHIINTGVAGSLNDSLDVGDILVSVDAVHHDVDATNFGYAPGEVPQVGTTSFDADPMLRSVALKAVRAAAPEVSVIEGRVASGDRFVRDLSDKAQIRETFHADCCEMEGAAIAQAAWLNGVPFVVIRAISDKADGSSPVEYPVFEARAAQHCARIVERMVDMLA